MEDGRAGVGRVRAPQRPATCTDDRATSGQIWLEKRICITCFLISILLYSSSPALKVDREIITKYILRPDVSVCTGRAHPDDDDGDDAATGRGCG